MPVVDLAQIGYDALDRKLFADLQHLYQVNYAQIGEWAGLPSTSVRDWVTGRRRPNQAQAAKLGNWYLAAIHQAEKLQFSDDPQDMGMANWVTLSTALQFLGMSRQSLMQKCRTGQVRSLDLGPLGFFIHRSEVTTMEGAA